MTHIVRIIHTHDAYLTDDTTHGTGDRHLTHT